MDRGPSALSAPISLCSPGGRVTPRYGVFSGPVKKWGKTALPLADDQ